MHVYKDIDTTVNRNSRTAKWNPCVIKKRSKMALNKMVFVVHFIDILVSEVSIYKKTKGKLLICHKYVEILAIFEVEWILGITEDNERRGTN